METYAHLETVLSQPKVHLSLDPTRRPHGLNIWGGLSRESSLLAQRQKRCRFFFAISCKGLQEWRAIRCLIDPRRILVHMTPGRRYWGMCRGWTVFVWSQPSPSKCLPPPHLLDAFFFADWGNNGSKDSRVFLFTTTQETLGPGRMGK